MELETWRVFYSLILYFIIHNFSFKRLKQNFRHTKVHRLQTTIKIHHNDDNNFFPIISSISSLATYMSVMAGPHGRHGWCKEKMGLAARSWLFGSLLDTASALQCMLFSFACNGGSEKFLPQLNVC
ncbi:hypothetical protein Dimus_006957 [Dionaea muscipula]